MSKKIDNIKRTQIKVREIKITTFKNKSYNRIDLHKKKMSKMNHRYKKIKRLNSTSVNYMILFCGLEYMWLESQTKDKSRVREKKITEIISNLHRFEKL